MKLSDNDLPIAINETGLYCSTSCLAQSGPVRVSPVYIGIPCTTRQVALHVYVEEKCTSINTPCGKLKLSEEKHTVRNFRVPCIVGFTTL